jgi:glucose-fructose oxidoreductase
VRRRRAREPGDGQPLRFAVVGLGYFAQAKVLPAFAHAPGCELTAIVSGDAHKRRLLQRRYRVPHALDYRELDGFLASHAVDAVYLTVPNHRHCALTVQAARGGAHVLCEKPMALDVAECERMIDACADANVKLMIAYRLHFEEANLRAIELVESRTLGEPRLFRSSFSYQLKPGNVRSRPGSGPLYDLGVYCINAARYVLREEPCEVLAFAERRADDPRFAEVPEAVSALLRFPDGKLAAFQCSFGCAASSSWEVYGELGRLVLEPAFEYDQPLAWQLEVGARRSRRRFRVRDQVAPELIYFARCVREGEEPEPSGREGLADVQVIEAIQASIEGGRAVRIAPFEKRRRPTLDQLLTRPASENPALIGAEEPVA